MKSFGNIAILLSVTIIIALGLYSNKTGGDTYLYMAIIITAIISTFIKKEKLLILLALLVAPNRVLTIVSISAPMIVATIGFFRFILRGKLSQEFLFGAILFTMLEFLCSFVVDTNAMLAIKTVILLAFLRFAIPQNKKTNTDIITIYLAIGCILSAFLSIIIDPSKLSEAKRFGFSDTGQNVLGILCGGLILLIILSKKHISTHIKYALIISLLFIGFLTGSRSFILELATGIIIYVVYAIFHLQNKESFYTILAFCIIGFLTYFAIYNIDILTNYLNNNLYRFNKYAENDISNNRFMLWRIYWELLRDNQYYLLFGGIPKQDYVAHNMIIEQVAAIGLVGSVVVSYLYWVVFKEIKDKMRLSYHVTVQSLSPLLAFLSASMVSHTLLGLPQTIMLFICLLNITKK